MGRAALGRVALGRVALGNRQLTGPKAASSCPKRIRLSIDSFSCLNSPAAPGRSSRINSPQAGPGQKGGTRIARIRRTRSPDGRSRSSLAWWSSLGDKTGCDVRRFHQSAPRTHAKHAKHARHAKHSDTSEATKARRYKGTLTFRVF